MKSMFAVCVLFLWLIMTSAHAENSECWGDPSREDMMCTPITEPLLLSLRGRTEVVVERALDAPGRNSDRGRHFLSNFSRGAQAGAGAVNVMFEAGRAAIITADVDEPGGAGTRMFIWNAMAAPLIGQELDSQTIDFQRSPFCSELSAASKRCKGGGMGG